MKKIIYTVILYLINIKYEEEEKKTLLFLQISINVVKVSIENLSFSYINLID